MIELVDLRYVHLGASNANDASKWAQEIYGLEEVSRENGRIYLRGDDRAYVHHLHDEPTRPHASER